MEEDKIILESFPFDSMEVQDEMGETTDDRLYEAAIFRRYFSKFLSNGVYYGEYKDYLEDSMKVSSDGGMNIKVAPGCGIIEGADFENEKERIFSLERPTVESRIDRVVVQFNSSLDSRNVNLYVKEGKGLTPADLQRDENIYEICLAEVTTRSTTNITSNDIKDTRINKELCGIVNSLIRVDGEELYQRFKEYIDTVTDNLVRKDQDISLTGTITDKDGRGLSQNDFTNMLKGKLDKIEEGANKTTIVNNLTSTSATSALSANMGRELNNKKQNVINYGTEVPTGGVDGDLYDQIF